MPGSRAARPSPVTFTDISDPVLLAQTLDTFARAFSNYRVMESHLRDGLWKGPFFDPAWTRVALVDGRVVSSVLMGPRHVRFGSVFIPAMTIGPVGTHDFFRKRGYSAATMFDAHRYMKSKGFLLAYLQGIPDFYHRFGYYPYRALPSVRFKRDDARPLASPGSLRPFKAADVPAVSAIYRRANAHRLLSARRSPAFWNWLLAFASKTWFFPNPRLILDARRRICGYLTFDSPLTIREIVVDPDERSLRAALGAICAEARRREIKDLDLPIPFDDPLALFIRQFIPAEFVSRAHPTGGQLLAILDFPELIRRIQPLLQSRWLALHPPVVGTLAFTLSTDIGSVNISLTSRSLRVLPPSPGPRVHVPRRWLSGLLTGYYSPDDVAARTGSRIPRKLLPVLDVLFPPGIPHIHRADNQ